ncbi:MAG TPA: hypothetical protein VNN13_07410 [Methylomirabilota bacterium]|nr:hypothetical protein [Methylomirabilota bacterium]
MSEKTTKLITLPSGLSVEIGRVKPADFMTASEILAFGIGGAEPAAKHVVRWIERLIIAGVVDPRFGNQPEDFDRNDVVHVRELENADLFVLVDAILSFSGIGGLGDTTLNQIKG